MIRNNKIKYLLSLLVFQVSICQAKLTDMEKYLVGATGYGVLSTALYIYNYVSLKKQLNSYKSEQNQIQSAEDFLISVKACIKDVESKYVQEQNVFNIYKNNSSELYSEKVFEAVINSSRRGGCQLDYAVSDVNSDHKKATNLINQIKLKVKSWSGNVKYESLILEATDSQKVLVELGAFLGSLDRVLQNQKNFIKLVGLLEANKKYDHETTLAQIYNPNQFAQELNKHILMIGNGDRFPYLKYISKLQQDNEELEVALIQVKSSGQMSFQEKYIKKAQDLIDVISKVGRVAASSEAYSREVLDKPIFEREQRRLEAELKERQARIDREKKIYEAELLKQQIRNQKYLNEKIKLEKERQDLKNREQAMSLELSRIRDGITVQDAVKKAVETKDAEIRRVKSEIDQKNNQITNIRLEREGLARKIGQIRDKLSDLKRSVDIPPCNPNVVPGLQAYMLGLSSKISEAISNL